MDFNQIVYIRYLDLLPSSQDVSVRCERANNFTAFTTNFHDGWEPTILQSPCWLAMVGHDESDATAAGDSPRKGAKVEHVAVNLEEQQQQQQQQQAGRSETDEKQALETPVDQETPEVTGNSNQASIVEAEQNLSSNTDDGGLKEYPHLSLEDSIDEFCDYLIFTYDPSTAPFKRGTVFYHIKSKDKPHHVYRFGFTIDASGSLEPYCGMSDDAAQVTKAMIEQAPESDSCIENANSDNPFEVDTKENLKGVAR